ncbi:hypothetical protein B0H19DRAFT_1108940 [Mycena capillaripes]|nr:hypothetical protein B0H19DRAFT_1108940 [Mycena capillaripes]
MPISSVHPGWRCTIKFNHYQTLRVLGTLSEIGRIIATQRFLVTSLIGKLFERFQNENLVWVRFFWSNKRHGLGDPIDIYLL